MSKFSQTKYDNLKKVFEDIAKKIKNYENRPLPQDQNWPNNTVYEFVISFNAIKKYIKTYIDSFTQVQQADFRGKLLEYEKKLRERLEYEVDLPDLCDEIDIDNVTPKITPVTKKTTGKSSETTSSEITTSQTQTSASTVSVSITATNISNSTNSQSSITATMTAPTAENFMGVCGRRIPKIYSGDPLELKSFLTSKTFRTSCCQRR